MKLIITNLISPGTFAITDTKLYPVVTLSSQNNAKLALELKSGFKGIVKRAEPCKCDILLVSRIL